MSMHASVYAFVCTFINAEAGISLGKDKEYLVEARLAPLAAAQGFASIEALVQILRTGADAALRLKVIDALTTHETSFFRDQHPFDTLRAEVVPAILNARAATRTINILSAACSTGQEPYSLAIMLRESFPELAGWAVRICAVDISEVVLDKARRGHFDAFEVTRGLTPELRAKYFDAVDGGYRVVSAVRNMIDFRVMNLAVPWPALPRMDLIMLRNVLIYFDQATRSRILASAREVLAPDGYLFLGGAETSMSLEDVYERVQSARLVYFRPMSKSAPPAEARLGPR